MVLRRAYALVLYFRPVVVRPICRLVCFLVPVYGLPRNPDDVGPRGFPARERSVVAVRYRQQEGVARLSGLPLIHIAKHDIGNEVRAALGVLDVYARKLRKPLQGSLLRAAVPCIFEVQQSFRDEPILGKDFIQSFGYDAFPDDVVNDLLGSVIQLDLVLSE